MKDLYVLGLEPQLCYPAKLDVMTDEGTRRLLASLNGANSCTVPPCTVS